MSTTIIGNAAPLVNGANGANGNDGMATVTTTATATTGLNRATGIAFLGAAGLFLVAFGVLSSLGWPAILEAPAATVLPLLQRELGGFTLGYTLYFFSSMLGIAAALMLRHALADKSATMSVAATFGVVAGVAKMLGLVRWLVAFPALAQMYNDPATTPATREALGAAYTALNLYADSIGQQLGDILFTAPWVGLAALAALRTRSLPRWLNIVGLATGAALFVGFFTNIGLPAALVMYLGFGGFAVWLIGVGVVLLVRRAPAPATR